MRCDASGRLCPGRTWTSSINGTWISRSTRVVGLSVDPESAGRGRSPYGRRPAASGRVVRRRGGSNRARAAALQAKGPGGAVAGAVRRAPEGGRSLPRPRHAPRTASRRGARGLLDGYRNATGGSGRPAQPRRDTLRG
jgi:hypothetical protein